MLNKLIEVWHRNRGNLLFTIAVLTIGTACVLWKFNLLPEIQLQPSRPFGEGLIRRRLERSRLVFTIRVTKELSTESLQGFVLIFNPATPVVESTAAIRSIRFAFEGGPMAAIFLNDLPDGEYKILVFLDLNNNGQLDRDEAGKALEPLRTLQSADIYPDVSSPETRILRVDSPSEINILFQF